MNGIDRTYDLPDGILKAYKREELVIFIGAGVSRLMGCCSWDQLANRLIGVTYNYGECQQILNNIKNSKELITIAFKKLESEDKLDEFYNEFNNALDAKDGKRDVYEILKDFNAVYVSTNADGFLEKHLPIGAYSSDEKPDITKLNIRPFLFYIHGRYVDKNEVDKKSLVFTVDQYLERYSKEGFQLFLETLFNQKTILFLGYGLNEFELLDHIVNKANFTRKQNKHYILEGFLKNHDILKEAKRSYYNSLGINLIDYEMDEKGYDEQIIIFEQWRNQIWARTFSNAEALKKIKEITSKYSEDNFSQIKYLFTLEKEKNLFYNEFFEILPSLPNVYLWLAACEKEGIYSTDQIPKIIENKNGGYSAPSWPPLNALCDIYLGNKTNKNIEKITVEILLNILLFILKDEKYLKNNALFSVVATIILNLNNDFISSEMIRYLKNGDFGSQLGIIIDKNSNYFNWGDKNFKLLFEVLLGFSNADMEITDSNINDFYGNKLIKDKLQLFTHSQKIICIDIVEEILINNYMNFYGFRYIKAIDLVEHDLLNNYEKLLDRILLKMLPLIDKNSLIKYINKWIIMKDKPFFINMAFYLIRTRSINQNKLFKINFNPFDIYEIFTEIYLLIEQLKSIYIERNLKKLCSWIEESNFGIEGKDEIALKHINYKKAQIYYLLSKYNSDIFNIDQKHMLPLEWKFEHPYEEAKKYIPHVYTPEKIIYLNEELLRSINPEKICDFVSEQLGNIVLSRFNDFDDIAYQIKNYMKERYLNSNVFSQVVNLPLEILMYLIRQFIDDKYEDKKWKELVFKFAKESIEKLIGYEYSENRQVAIKNSQAVLRNFCIEEIQKSELLDLCKYMMKMKPWGNDSIIKSINDISFHIINCVEGKVYNDYIWFVISLKKIGNDEKWLAEIEGFIENYINCDDENNLFKIVLAGNMQNLYYLDEKWIIAKLHLIFELKNGEPCIEAFISHINRANYIFGEVYYYFQTNDLFRCFIGNLKNEESIVDNSIIKRLIEYVVSAYLFEKDKSIELIKYLIDNTKSDQLEMIVHSFTAERSSNEKIKYGKLFLPIFNILRAKAIDDKQILSNISSVAVNILKLESHPGNELFVLIGNCIDDIIISYWKINNIDKIILEHIKKHLIDLYPICKKVFSKEIYMDEDNVKKIIQVYIDKNELDKAIQLCNILILNQRYSDIAVELLAKIEELDDSNV
jgi:hypothetical protein